MQTVLMMKIGTAGDRAVSPHGIHWHVAPENRIVYKAADRSRLTIPEVTLSKKDGSQVVFRADNAEADLAKGGAEVV